MIRQHPEVFAIIVLAIVGGAALGPLLAASLSRPKHALPSPSGPVAAPRNSLPPLSRPDVPPSPVSASLPMGWEAAAADGAPVPSPRLKRSEVEALASACAPNAPGRVLTSIAQVESGFRPLEIAVNGRRRRVYVVSTIDDAVALSNRLIAADESVDLGLAQINSRNLGWLGLSVRGAFDPCRNLQAAAQVMEAGYKTALKSGPRGQSLLQTAYSLYNTGRVRRGVANGYASEVETANRRR